MAIAISAPISNFDTGQLSWLPRHDGEPFIDYIIVDRFIAPASEPPFYAEKLVHLPNRHGHSSWKWPDRWTTPRGLPTRVIVW
jgi:predicted O-linked N-acetylglucosamine transferase (SPINDLY family)